MAFLPDGSMLVTERAGRLRIIRNGVLDPKPVAGTPASYWAGRVRRARRGSRLYGYRAPSPVCREWLPLSQLHETPRRETESSCHRARPLGWEGAHGMKRHFRIRQAATSRIAFGRDGTLFMTTTGNDPQDPNTLGGKVLRFRDDGTIPSDNPFVGQPGKRPEVYTLGIRSSLGLAVHPGNGRDVAERKRPERGRRDQYPQARPQLRLANRELRTHLPGPVAIRAPGHAGFEPPW